MGSGHTSHALGMAWRRLTRNPWQTLLHLLGLAIAFATLALAMEYVRFENSYDKFHANAERTFRATYRVSTPNNFDVHWARIPVNYINELENFAPEVESLIRFQNQEQKYFSIGNKRFKPDGAFVTDATALSVFDFHFLAGNQQTALSTPHSMVVTESEAIRYFGHLDAIGRLVEVTGEWNSEPVSYRITGVIKDFPANSHLPIKTLLSFENQEARNGWAYVYVLLKQGAEIEQLEAKMADFVAAHTDDDATEVSFPFQPVGDIHLQSDLAREIQVGGNAFYTRIIFWIGILVWIIALINFSNLRAALTLYKSTELGVRKTLGASYSNLIYYSFIDSLLITSAAMVLGLAAVVCTAPALGVLIDFQIISTIPQIAAFALGVVAISSALVTLVPASLIATYRLIDMFATGRNWSMRKSHGIGVRHVLMALQFSISIVLTSCAIMSALQVRYLMKTTPGVSTEQIVAIPEIPSEVTTRYPTFKEQLKSISGIEHVSACMQLPSTAIRDVGPVLVKGVNEDADQAPMMDMQIIDPDFMDMMELQILAGHDFTRNEVLKPAPEFTQEYTAQQYLADISRKYIINESAMRRLGWEHPEEAIGNEINWSIGSFALAYGPVAAVVKDYHQESMRNFVDPQIMVIEPIWLRSVLMKVRTSEMQRVLADVENVWAASFNYGLEFQFLDEQYKKLYENDRLQLSLLSSLAIIAIVLSMMGFIGVLAFALRTRAKELSIRRVIGAELNHLSRLMGGEYVLLIIIALGAGAPIYFYMMSQWLSNFAYHTPLRSWPLIAMFIGFVVLLSATIYLQTLRTIRDNPVEHLRSD